MIYGNTVGGSIPQTYILVDEAGNEITAALVSTETVFDAGPNDIRLGKTALTDMGAIVGEKDIPAYHTTEGIKIVAAGRECIISSIPRYEFTKLQALFCARGATLADSVATEKVSINGYVYSVGSTEVLATVTTDPDTESILFGITNDGTSPLIIRYFTYKEEP